MRKTLLLFPLLLLLQAQLPAQELGLCAGLSVMRSQGYPDDPRNSEYAPGRKWQPGFSLEACRVKPGKRNEANLRFLSIGLSVNLPVDDPYYLVAFRNSNYTTHDTTLTAIRRQRFTDVMVNGSFNFKLRWFEFWYLRLGIGGGYSSLSREVTIPAIDTSHYYIDPFVDHGLKSSYRALAYIYSGGVVYEMEYFYLHAQANVFGQYPLGDEAYFPMLRAAFSAGATFRISRYLQDTQ